MDRRTVGVLIAGAIIMAVTAWQTYPPSPPKVIGDTSKFRYMYCPHCKREQAFDLAKFEKLCLYCDERLVGTEESIKKVGARPSNPYGKMFVFLYAELVALMGAVWWLTRRRATGPREEDYLYFNCGNCRQKIRFRPAQVGLPAVCRRCKRGFVYPPEGPDE